MKLFWFRSILSISNSFYPYWPFPLDLLGVCLSPCDKLRCTEGSKRLFFSFYLSLILSFFGSYTSFWSVWLFWFFFGLSGLGGWKRRLICSFSLYYSGERGVSGMGWGMVVLWRWVLEVFGCGGSSYIFGSDNLSSIRWNLWRIKSLLDIILV